MEHNNIDNIDTAGREEDMDEDLREAIRLSLLDSSLPSRAVAASTAAEHAAACTSKSANSKPEPEVIDLLDDSTTASDDDSGEIGGEIGFAVVHREGEKRILSKISPPPLTRSGVGTHKGIKGVLPGQDGTAKAVAPSRSQSSSVLGMDRAAMEKERLARLKRKAGGNGDGKEIKGKIVKVDTALPSGAVFRTITSGARSTSAASGAEFSDLQSKVRAEDTILPSGALFRTLTSMPVATQNVNPRVEGKEEDAAVSSSENFGRKGAGLLEWPYGVVKKTFCEGTSRTGDDITLVEVLKKDTLSLAVLSAFQWNVEWVLDHLDVGRTAIIFVMQAKDPAEKIRIKTEAQYIPKSKVVFPSMDQGVNCMHSKLMLLFHPSYVRVVVPTANLMKFDWGGMGGVMENMVFLIDLPRRSKKTEPLQDGQLTFFAKELIHFCEAKGYPDDVLTAMRRVDYSKTTHLAFVHSIGGAHFGDAMKRTGISGLGTAVKTLGLQSGKGLEIDFVTSSLGALNPDYMCNLYRAVTGDDGMKRITNNTLAWPLKTRNKPQQLQQLQQQQMNQQQGVGPNDEGAKDGDRLEQEVATIDWEHVRNRFRVFFPTHETVARSRGGVGAGGTICFQSKWYNASTFPKMILRDCVSTRKGLLMHNKLLFARPAKQLITAKLCSDGIPRKVDGWAYVGSANISESAWGKIILDRTRKVPKLTVRNWECGVLIPVLAAGDKGDEGGESNGLHKPAPMSIFHKVLPVPMETPGGKYAGRRPWYFME